MVDAVAMRVQVKCKEVHRQAVGASGIQPVDKAELQLPHVAPRWHQVLALNFPPRCHCSSDAGGPLLTGERRLRCQDLPDQRREWGHWPAVWAEAAISCGSVWLQGIRKRLPTAAWRTVRGCPLLPSLLILFPLLHRPWSQVVVTTIPEPETAGAGAGMDMGGY